MGSQSVCGGPCQVLALRVEDEAPWVCQEEALAESRMAQRLEANQGSRKDLVDTSLTPSSAETLHYGPCAQGSANFTYKGLGKYFRLEGHYSFSHVFL